MSIIEDIIKIDLDIFKLSYNNIIIENIPSIIYKKKSDIYTNKCFHISYDSYYNSEKKWTSIGRIDKKKYNDKNDKNDKNDIIKKNKIHILSPDFSEEGKYKKQFTSYLNKLSSANKETIYKKINELMKIVDNDIKNIFYNIIWDFIKKSAEHIYIDLLKLYEESYTLEYWNNFLNSKKWVPKIEYIENNLLSNDEKLYDMYCDYVKWKKEISNINKAWCYIWSYYDKKNKLDYLLEHLYNDIYIQYNIIKNYKHIIDYFLEQFLIILKICKNKNYIELIKNIDISKYEKSSKYIILDILEIEI